MRTHATWAVLAAAACGREKAPPVAALSVVVGCPSGERTIEARDVALDDALCGASWTAWEIDTARATDLVQRQAGRTLQLRTLNGVAVVEVRVSGRVDSAFSGVTHIRLHVTATPQAPDAITIRRGTVTEHVTMGDLAHRYPDARRQELSLCLLLATEPPTSMVSVTSASGETSAPVTRETCERGGLVLHTSNRGGVQLRDRTKQRLVEDVTGVVIAPGDTLAR